MTAARILVVDDDPVHLRTIRRILASEGYSVAEARDGVDGLDLVAAEEFDLVITDLQMQKMDGRAFFREIRARGYAVPVMVLSAFGAEAAAKELKAEAGLGKPFDFDELLEKVKETLAAIS